MPWNPEQYHKFQDQRAAPFVDLLALVEPREGLRVIDLGCGTGELTRRLADALPGSEVLGIDSSAEMLVQTAPHSRPGLRFEQADIAKVSGEYDVVFSHAALQWLDNHQTLMPRLWSLVAPGGQIAVQMPSNHNHASHRIVRELAATEPYRAALGNWSRPTPVLSIDEYAELLFALGGADLTVFEKIYPHVLADADAIVEWTKGTLLIPYMERLTPILRDQFLSEYTDRLRDHFPMSPVFYGFRRTLFAATRTD